MDMRGKGKDKKSTERGNEGRGEKSNISMEKG